MLFSLHTSPVLLSPHLWHPACSSTVSITDSRLLYTCCQDCLQVHMPLYTMLWCLTGLIASCTVYLHHNAVTAVTHGVCIPNAGRQGQLGHATLCMHSYVHSTANQVMQQADSPQVVTSRVMEFPQCPRAAGGATSKGRRVRLFADLVERVCPDPGYRLLSLRAAPQMPASSRDFTTFNWNSILKRLRQMQITGNAACLLICKWTACNRIVCAEA